MMVAFPILLTLLFLLPPLFALPVTQTTLTDTLVYDAVVEGTNNLVVLRPAPTGLPSPISTYTNVDIVSCGFGGICIEDFSTDSASSVLSSVIAEVSVLPASIATRLVTEADQNVTSSMNGILPPALASGPTAYSRSSGSVASNSMRQGAPSGTLTSTSAAQTSKVGRFPISTSPSSQSMTPTDVQILSGMESKSSVSITNSSISTSLGAVKPGIKGSAGVALPTSNYNDAIITAKSSSATNGGLAGRNRTSGTSISTSRPTEIVTFALEVTNSRGSVTDEVIEVEYNSGVPSTKVLFAYADSITTTETGAPSGVSIQTITTSTCISAGTVATTTLSGSTVVTEVPELCLNGHAFLIFGLAGFHSSADLPSLCHKSFHFPLGIIWRLLCPSVGPPTFIISGVVEGDLPPGDGPPDGDPGDENHTQTQTSSQTTQSTLSSSASATPSRYVIMPLIDTPQPATDSLFLPFAQRKNVTQARRGDGSLEFFALELNNAEASIIGAKSDFIVIPESDLDIEMPDSGQTDPSLNSATYATEPLGSTPNIGSRNINDEDKGSETGRLLKRVRLHGWAERITAWSLAIISLVPGLQLPSYEYDTIYPYYYADAVDPGQSVRVYLLDTGMNMQYPEFNGRLKPGTRQGQTQNDWNIDWLFPRVDRSEWFYTSDVNSQVVRQSYEYSYIDPDSPNPRGGIHPAFSDFRLRDVEEGRLTPHGTRLSAFILGDELGQAQACHYTVVKLPQYTNGPLSTGTLFPLFSVKDALNLIIEDIKERKEQGEELFVICSALGHVFGSDREENPRSARRGFERMWKDALKWFKENGVTIIASAGNSRSVKSSVSLNPARLFREPEIVIGSVTPRALAHPESQGSIGDGILTAYAPGSGARMISSDPNGDYTYEYIDPAGSAVTSYGTYLGLH